MKFDVDAMPAGLEFGVDGAVRTPAQAPLNACYAVHEQSMQIVRSTFLNFQIRFMT